MTEIGHEIEHGTAVVAGMWLAGAEDVLRLVERQIDQALGLDAQAFAVDFDDVRFGVGLVAEFGNLAIDAHAALFNQDFGAAARGDIGLRHDLLNTYFHCGLTVSRLSLTHHYKARRSGL